MMPALAFSEVIMLEDMLDSFHNTESRIFQPGFLICLPLLSICWRKCLCLIPTIALQVWGKSFKIFGHSTFSPSALACPRVLLVFPSLLKVLCFCICLQLMRLFVTHTCHVSTISMMNLSAPGLSILILSTHRVLKSISKSSSGGNQ